jgi:antitoxin (DNA-binding transcriptional repressor) of toxin-antitoxin stability system
VLITRDDEQAVQLVPVARAKRRRKAGSAQGLIVMSDDFDAPLADFEEYIP